MASTISIDRTSDERLRTYATGLLISLANVLAGGAAVRNAEAGLGSHPASRHYRLEFVPIPVASHGEPSRFRPEDASRLSTAKRLAIAVLLDDPGSANALADYLQEIGVVPDGTLTERKRCEDAIERMWAECRAEPLDPVHPAFNVMVKLFRWIRCGEPVAAIES